MANETLNEKDLQDGLMNVIEALVDARDEMEGDDDDIALADLARDMVAEIEGITTVATFEDAALLTGNAGLVIRTADGSEFQITIVKSR